GWTMLWHETPYHWEAIHISKMKWISFCEGDIYEIQFDNMEDMLRKMQIIKKWWLKYLGERRADMVLAGCAEKYGFLSTDKINLPTR
ncbi:MAG: hypothetical protein DRP09_21315, partial [Candidatus Thorarchaeota archaeon]